MFVILVHWAHSVLNVLSTRFSQFAKVAKLRIVPLLGML